MRSHVRKILGLGIVLCLGFTWACVKVDVLMKTPDSGHLRKPLMNQDKPSISLKELKERHATLQTNCPPSRSLFINPEKQKTVAWCWAASTRTVMSYQNNRKAPPEPTALQCDIVRNVFSPGLGGTDCCEIKITPDFIDAPSRCVQGGWPYWVLNKYHFSYEWVEGRFDNWEVLKAEVCRVGPVISVIDWRGGGSHTLVITGYSTDETDAARVVTTYDPFTDDFQDLSFEEFVGGSLDRPNGSHRFSHNRTYVQIMPKTEGRP